MRVGIMGSGLIVPEFLEAASQFNAAEICAICGREHSRGRLEQLAKKFQIGKIYTDYQDMLGSDIDAVYVALPNHLHYEFAKKALLMKKHVLLEKPYTSSISQAEDLIQTAKEQGVILFEAITNQYYPNYEKTREAVGRLGEIRIVQLNYSQYSRRYDDFKKGIIQPVFDPDKSGGVMMDLNVYNVHYVVGLFGKPDRVHYFANVERGIDTSGVLVMEYPGFQCVCVAAKDCKAPCSINIQGDKGCLNSTSPANVYDRFQILMNDGKEETYALHGSYHRMYFELKRFAELVHHLDFEAAEKQNCHSLEVMWILEEARVQAGIRIL